MSISRHGRVALGIAVAWFVCLGTAASAGAVVTPIVGGGNVTASSDGAGDTIAIDCVGGQLKINMGPDLIACESVTGIDVFGGGGIDTVNLTAVTAAKFPILRGTEINAGDGTDTVNGSQVRDDVTAFDSADSVNTGAGDDVINRASQVVAGSGDDVIRDASSVDAGAGDDRMVSIFGGPLEGGTGHDSLDFDLSMASEGGLFRLDVTDSRIDLSGDLGVGTLLTYTSLEQVDLAMRSTGTDTVAASAFSGSLSVDARGGNDTLIGGLGEDQLSGGSGDDDIQGGPGSDYADGGEGADTLRLRDETADRGRCGDGADSVIADVIDVLAGCETSDVPAVPDTDDPFTLDLSGPSSLKQGKKATFKFGSSESGGTFQCKVDKEAAKECTSPFKLKTKKLDPGKHTFSVFAVDTAGNADATPATLKFTVQKKKKKKK